MEWGGGDLSLGNLNVANKRNKLPSLINNLPHLGKKIPHFLPYVKHSTFCRSANEGHLITHKSLLGILESKILAEVSILLLKFFNHDT